MRYVRDYSPLLRGAVPMGTRESGMRRAVELLWDAFGEADPMRPTRGGVSWVGFYLKSEGAEEMVLVCREPKPACSPIGLHGMCGRGWSEKRAVVIADVRTLGAGYIACDPRDQSELVVPMLGADGRCVGVLDVDSYDLGAFTEEDAAGAGELLVRLGLSVGKPGSPLRL
jgi:putative methionine-R-sulfoxide reductase with GAF domain